MQLPEFIAIGDQKIPYRECNYYQRSIYQAVCRELEAVKQLKDPVAINERTGVVKFLLDRLVAYGRLENVRANIYEDVHEVSANRS